VEGSSAAFIALGVAVVREFSPSPAEREVAGTLGGHVEGRHWEHGLCSTAKVVPPLLTSSLPTYPR
jgi:hypothetical protein